MVVRVWVYRAHATRRRRGAQGARLPGTPDAAKTPPSARGGLRRRLAVGQCASLLVLVESDVPVAPAVAPVQTAFGALHDDRVAEFDLVPEPISVLHGNVGAAVGHVVVPLVGHRPGGGVDVLASPGQPHRPVDLRAVALAG